MNLLALDTSTNRAAVAVTTAGGAVLLATADPGQRHGRQLLPTIRGLLREAGLAVADLDGFAVGLGPGSYTGLRIGLTAAKTLAYAAGKPLVGLDSLEAIAQNAPVDASRIAVIADAQRGDLFAADFARPVPTGPLVRVAPTRVVPFASWAEALAEDTLVLGPALERLPTPLPRSAHTIPGDLNWPEGRRLALWALTVWESGRRDDLWFLEPLYLRRSAAEDQWDAAKPSS